MEKRKPSYWLVGVIASLCLVVLAVVLGIRFFGFITCTDYACFKDNLASCVRTEYMGGEDMVYQYRVLGRDDGHCSVMVTLLQGQMNNQHSLLLEGKSMLCSLPFGFDANPESSIDRCHGELKEGLQDIIIQKLHAYLVQNVGRINLEVLDVPIFSPNNSAKNMTF